MKVKDSYASWDQHHSLWSVPRKHCCINSACEQMCTQLSVTLHSPHIPSHHLTLNFFPSVPILWHLKISTANKAWALINKCTHQQPRIRSALTEIRQLREHQRWPRFPIWWDTWMNLSTKLIPIKCKALCAGRKGGYRFSAGDSVNHLASKTQSQEYLSLRTEQSPGRH